MSSKISITPETLMEQSNEMAVLQTEYDRVFHDVENILKGINENWGAEMANNFTPKLQLATKAFQQIEEMLGIGVKAASASAKSFESIDSNLAKFYGDTRGLLVGELQDNNNSKDDENKTPAQSISDLMSYLEGDFIDEHFSDVPLWLREQLKDLIKDQLKEKFGSDNMMAYDLVKGLLAADDLHGLLKPLKKLIKKSGKTGDFGKDLGLSYSVNATINTLEAYIEYAENPSLFGIVNIGWNLSAESVLETCSDAAWDIVKKIPFVSDYYDAHGATNGAEAFNVAYTELVRGVFGDDLAADVKDYYSKNGGLLEGIWNGVKEVGQAAKENGGLIKSWIDGWKCILNI